MSQPSNWPLPPDGVRLLTPQFIRTALAEHPLSEGCYPTALGYYPNARAHFMVRERHDDNLVMLCTEGRGFLEVEDRVIPVIPGDAVLLPSGRKHYYRADGRTPWSVYWVHFNGKQAEALMTFLGGRDELKVHCGVAPRLIGGFQQLLEVKQTGYDLTAYVQAANQLRLLLVRLGAAKDQLRPGRRELDVDAIQLYMREQIHRQLSLNDLSSVAGVSRAHFAQRYRELTGCAPVRHFTHMKMEAACRLLDSGDQSIKGVANALGYRDPLYFSRVFRRIIGVSPRGYLRSVTA